eukprot:3517992-Rhodomonas_salina.2
MAIIQRIDGYHFTHRCVSPYASMSSTDRRTAGAVVRGVVYQRYARLLRSGTPHTTTAPATVLDHVYWR